MEKGFCSIPVDLLVKADWNYKVNNEELSKKLAENIRRNGQIENIIVREIAGGMLEVVNGNHRLEVMIDLGIDNVQCYNLGEVSISVAKRIAVETNETRFQSNQDLLSDVIKELFVEFDEDDIMETLPFTDEEISSMLEKVEEPELNESREEEMLPEDGIDYAAKYGIQYGQIIKLGNHTIMCGDSTSEEDVKKLMDGKKANLLLTDPPYAVNYTEKNEFLNSFDGGNRIEKTIENDNLSDVDTETFMKMVFNNASRFMENNATFYCFTASFNDVLDIMHRAIRSAGLLPKHILIWVKNNHVLGRSDYNYKHEPIIYGWFKTHKFYGNGEQKTTVWEYDKPSTNKLHPTMKPIPILVNAIMNSSDEGDNVLDMFLGSGSTLLACEETKRVCYGFEIDPQYIGVICERYFVATGMMPEIVENA